MAIELVGYSTAGASIGNADSQVWAVKYTAVASGNATEFRFYCGHTTGAQAKFAIYADNSDNLGTRLWVQNTATDLSIDQWNTIAISPSLAITKDSIYWLATNTNGTIVSYNAATATTRYKSGVSFTSTGCPETLTDGTSLANYKLSYAVWGTATVGIPQIMIF